MLFYNQQYNTLLSFTTVANYERISTFTMVTILLYNQQEALQSLDNNSLLYYNNADIEATSAFTTERTHCDNNNNNGDSLGCIDDTIAPLHPLLLPTMKEFLRSRW